MFWIGSEFVSVLNTGLSPFQQNLTYIGGGVTESWDPADSVDRQTEAVSPIADGELEGCIDVAFFTVTANVDVVLGGPAISQPVDEPRIRMKVEDYRLCRGEQLLEFTVGQTVWMLPVRDQSEQIDAIYKPDFDVR